MNEFVEYGLVLVIIAGAAACFLRRILALRGGRASCGCGRVCGNGTKQSCSGFRK